MESQALKGGKIDEKFADKAVKGRQTGDCHRTDQKGPAGYGHALHQAAQLIDMAGPGFLENRPGPHKQQRFEDGVIEDMEQAAGKAEAGHDPVARRDPDHAQAAADENDADIFNAVIGQQAVSMSCLPRA